MASENLRNNSDLLTDDDWEKMIENGTLDKAIKKMGIKSNSKGSVDSDKDCNEKPQVQVRMEDSSESRPNGIRILKRDSAPKEATTQQSKIKAPAAMPSKAAPATKTFAQRQDEYAKARARILGSEAATIQNGNDKPATILDSNYRQGYNGYSKERKQGGPR